jgi:hypothetical protein
VNHDADRPVSASSAPAYARRRWLPAVALLLSLALTMAAAEAASRAFWRLGFGVPFGRPDRILYAFYPELERVDRKHPTREDEFYDILLLGGSALHPDYGAIASALQEQLAYAGRRNVRLFNLADRAHTSRDSRLKYAAIPDARFDLVLVYEGINDARANNAPPAIFRDDYGHYSWYGTVNALAPYHGSAAFALPYTLRFLAVRLGQVPVADRYAPTEAPRPDWLQYGRDYRSVAVLERNVATILDLARRRGDPVMLMSYATYIPEGYTAEAFRDKRLPYGLHLIGVELWGRPEDVAGAVAAQNAALRRLAVRYEGIFFADQAALLAGRAAYFNDVCHLTVLGSSKFAENVVAQLAPALPPKREHP